MADLNIGVLGCAGRMGGALVRQIAATPGVQLAGGTETAGSTAVGRDLGDLAGLGRLGMVAADDAAALFAAADAVLDFTVPAAAAAHAALAAESGTPLVIGTTGLDTGAGAALGTAAERVAIVQAANMSLGVNLLIALAKRAAAVLDETYDVEITDIHHRGKVDAPSGTALALGKAVAAARGVDHDQVAVRGRDGEVGERRPGQIGYGVLRAGNVAGEHSVLFAADDERVELTHRAGSRDIFARGALAAARWVRGKPPGLYGMDDVLGLKG